MAANSTTIADIIQSLVAEYNTCWKVGEFYRIDAGETPWLDEGSQEAWTDGATVLVFDYDAASEAWTGSDQTAEFADQVVTEHIEGWERGSRTPFTDGFVAYCYDLRQETLAALTDGEIDQLVDDVTYSVEQDPTRGLSTEVITAAVRRMLENDRAELIAALRESLADD